jgi:hypothetical protein
VLARSTGGDLIRTHESVAARTSDQWREVEQEAAELWFAATHEDVLDADPKFADTCASWTASV